MKSKQSEVIFLLSVAILSLSFSIAIGFNYIYPQRVELSWKDLKMAEVLDIQSDFSVHSTEKLIRFHNGIPYESMNGRLEDVSSYYNEDISLVPTSFYWRHPVNEKKSHLVIGRNNTIGLFIEKLNGLPIVSLIVEPDDFFSYEKGIYVPGYDSDFNSSTIIHPFPWHKPANYYKKENDKKKACFSYYNESGEKKFSAFAIVEINGKATRCFPQKSMKLSTSKESGAKKFEFDFFDEGKFYNSIVLRNGGNDNSKALIRDMLMQRLLEESGILISGFIPCEVFLNGEYWGIHFIQNKLNENFIANKYGAKEKKVVLVESWNLEQGSEVEYNSLIRQVKDINNFDYNKISELIDMDDLTTYIAAEMFFANSDWPTNNLQMFKISDSGSKNTKWKFILLDMDYGFGYSGTEAFETDMFVHLGENNDLFRNLFNRLMKEMHFRKLLKEKMNLILNKYCLEKKMIATINDLKSEIEGAIPDHTSRWRKPFSKEEWEYELDVLKEFAEKRNKVMREHIKKYLN